MEFTEQSNSANGGLLVNRLLIDKLKNSFNQIENSLLPYFL